MTAPKTRTPVEPPEARPDNVIAALAAITADLGPIEKLTPAERKRRGMGTSDERGITYAYRGIDQIATELQPLLGQYGVVIVPRLGSHEVHEIEVGGKPWSSHTIVMHWSIYGPGGRDDMIEATTAGEGRDNSDKGVNKATTAAYKNLLLRMFSIGDPAEDPDTERHESTREPEPVPDDNSTEAQRVFEELRDLANDERVTAALKSLKKANTGKDFREVSLRDPKWRALVERTVADARRGTPSGGGDGEAPTSPGTSPESTDGDSDDTDDDASGDAQAALSEALGEGLS